MVVFCTATTVARNVSMYESANIIVRLQLVVGRRHVLMTSGRLTNGVNVRIASESTWKSISTCRRPSTCWRHVACFNMQNHTIRI